METEEAGGETIVMSQGVFVFQEWLDIVNKVGVEYYPERTFPKGYPEITEGGLEYKFEYNTAKERKILGLTYRSKEESTRDTLKWAAERKL
ncbi:hypothetical protein DFP72DRAFT_1139849 [Ephemerocybe angulata]|uniref:Uncharacterized protein n=1 Tax=Ephemerocybe angulata TaxID=980116 RepID=A0A8H6M1V8_9AGAR|nr:hypothetical protein DFP72DRAFT_1139849 [Tulosesus angulatus]